MRDLHGKTAFITGGASGIGLAMAEALGREGMNVMIADIEPAALAKAVDELRAQHVRAEGVVADVASRDSVRAAALETVAKFGKVHLVCNNAGVAIGGTLGTVPEQDWNWIVDVNLMGVVHGMEVFGPLVESHGEGGHFVNTASMAGMVSPPTMEPYCATKFAVVAMSEGWAVQLAAKNIGVSILCPGFVQTRIHESRRNRPDAYGANERQIPSEVEMVSAAAVLGGIPVGPVGARVVEAIKDNDLYIFTHPELKAAAEMRFQRILEAFDKSARSPAISAPAPRSAPALGLDN
ncbi:MAG TPA: SDR family NAD(P)-dependent oxidoreductase [Caulobacteraceae bacterium]|jgi:NAD(P)-dependent dehydrogenase (short-subunit alcohol dehydrogenase family)|nr:SDR family NAD(P)-dependent oxidoreductase [Caulobacteraceae bacterium]